MEPPSVTVELITVIVAQWVWEVAVPTGSYKHNSGADMEFVAGVLRYTTPKLRRSECRHQVSADDLLFVRTCNSMIDETGLAAPAPLEQVSWAWNGCREGVVDSHTHTQYPQRWTAESSSPMSPAWLGGPDHTVMPEDASSSNDPGLVSWLGIINYIPTADPVQVHSFSPHTHVLVPHHTDMRHCSLPPLSAKRYRISSLPIAARLPPCCLHGAACTGPSWSRVEWTWPPCCRPQLQRLAI